MINTHPKVSVLINTYNRASLLPRSVGSVLGQDYPNIELIIIDDASIDNTQEVVKNFNSDRIRYIRNPENLGSKFGDRLMAKRFMYEYATGEYCVYLCDDDYWLPSDLLSRQVNLFMTHASLAAVIGGMGQIWPTPVELSPAPCGATWYKEYVPGVKNATFNRNIYPQGFLSSDEFLFLYSSDIANRNILTGATLYKRSKFIEAGIFAEEGSKWQAGYEWQTGIGTVGDIYYLDEPCVMAEVDINSASYRGTQYQHMEDCLISISCAFKKVRLGAADYRHTRFYPHEARMKQSVLMTYVSNQLTYKLGYFDNNALAGIQKIFATPITARDYLRIISGYKIPISWNNAVLLFLSLLPKKMALLAQCAMRRYRADWIEHGIKPPASLAR
jgi:glycosyltransferase involved in cell wall biosynthesis